MRLPAIACLLSLLCAKSVAQNTCREVIAYYPNWQWYDRNNLVNPTSIDYSLYSIINYAFFNVLNDGSIQSTDPWADKNLLLGPINWAVAPAGYETSYELGNPIYHHPNQQFSQYCHDANVKLLPSLGGWTLSTNFPAVASDPVKRQNLAQQCVELITVYGFDGIDLDWEYPGYAPHAGTPNDAANFTLLLQDIRSALDAAESDLGKNLLLTIAVGASPVNMENVQWTAILPFVDIINLMSYDYFGAWEPLTNHNAPLFQPAVGDPEFNTHASIVRLTEQYAVPSDKLAVGIGFYGRSVKTLGAPGLHVASMGIADAVSFPADEGNPLYYSIVSALPNFDYHWDDLSKVPYLTGSGALNTFVSFDDTVSVRHKAEYIAANNLRGAIVWELTGDYIESVEGSGVVLEIPLASALKSVFCSGVSPAGCAGDFDNDAMVGVSDLLFLLQNFGCSTNCQGDLDGDDAVTAGDFVIFLGFYGSLCVE